MLIGHTAFEYHIIGTQTLYHPIMIATGLDIAMDLVGNDGVEITQGILAPSKHAYTAQTDAFYLRVNLDVPDVSGTDSLLIGFRKAAAYAADPNDYTDMFAIDILSGNVFIDSILNNATTDQNDTGINWEDGDSNDVEIRVFTDGTCSCFVSGVEETEHNNTFTFDKDDVVIPFLFLRHDTEAAEETALIDWECGKW